jgi:hypothetical protein
VQPPVLFNPTPTAGGTNLKECSMKNRLMTLATATLLALNAGSALAQDEKGLSPAVVQQLDLINRLVALGDARKDPVLLLAAASIQKSLGTSTETLPAKSTAPEDIMARAKALSAGRKDLLDLAEDLGATKAKGASWRIDAVTGRSTYRY